MRHRVAEQLVVLPYRDRRWLRVEGGRRAAVGGEARVRRDGRALAVTDTDTDADDTDAGVETDD